MEIIKGGKTIPATKAVLCEIGFDVGNAVFPMTRFTPKQKADLIERIRNAGLNI